MRHLPVIHPLHPETDISRAQRMGLRAAPKIKGYSFRPGMIEETAHGAVDPASPSFHALFIETAPKCNLDCWFCYSASNQSVGNAITLVEMLAAIDTAKGHGIRSIIFAGKGEPLLDDRTLSLVRYASENGIWSVIFTNNTLMTKDLAKELFSLDTSIIAKRGSFDPERQDSLVGVTGAHERIWRGLGTLAEAGFMEPRLAIDATMTRTTMDEMPELWRYARMLPAIPFFEPIINAGGCLRDPKRVESEKLTRSDLDNLFRRLRDIDEKEFGYTWAISDQMRIPAMGDCNRHRTALTLRQNGDVGACASDVGLRIGNIFERSFEDIINDPILERLRSLAMCPSKVCRMGEEGKEKGNER